jgi:hypothetical protein
MSAISVNCLLKCKPLPLKWFPLVYVAFNTFPGVIDAVLIRIYGFPVKESPFLHLQSRKVVGLSSNHAYSIPT